MPCGALIEAADSLRSLEVSLMTRNCARSDLQMKKAHASAPFAAKLRILLAFIWKGWRDGEGVKCPLSLAAGECSPLIKGTLDGEGLQQYNNKAALVTSENDPDTARGGRRGGKVPIEIDTGSAEGHASVWGGQDAVDRSGGDSGPSEVTVGTEDPAGEDGGSSRAEVKDIVVRREQSSQLQGESSILDRDSLQLAMSLSMHVQGDVDQDDEVPSRAPSDVSSSSEDVYSPAAVFEGTGGEGRVASLRSYYMERYHALKKEGEFRVRFLDTYQGRIPDSTNGCTVIAILTCVQYFMSKKENMTPERDSVWNYGVPDDLVNEAMDVHAVALLAEVRGKFGLGRCAFIVPSDVHDHLIEVGLLSTSQFVGVCGGNVLDDDHLSAFKSALLLLDNERERERLRGRKVAATFFFHGHVVAFHVMEGAGSETWIEMIDSLPNPETWIGPRRGHLSYEDDRSDDGDRELPLNAVRVRCTDVDHLEVLVRRYAVEKFSADERAFVDTTEWDDSAVYHKSMFDPRVFQAFVWCEAA